MLSAPVVRLRTVNPYVVLLLVLGAGVLLLVGAAGARWALAPRGQAPERATTYESGVDPVDSAIEGDWTRSHVRYLTYALLYVVFAVDIIFFFPWALVLHSDLGAASAIEMLVFVLILVVALGHAARRGLLRWQ